MARKTKSEKELHWREMVNRQAVSGLSVRQFCAKQRISEPSFYAWRKRLEGRNDETKRPGDVRHRLEVPDRGRGFIPVQVRDAAGALEVIHPSGCHVCVTGEVHLPMLRQVLDLLDERGNGCLRASVDVAGAIRHTYESYSRESSDYLRKVSNRERTVRPCARVGPRVEWAQASSRVAENSVIDCFT